MSEISTDGFLHDDSEVAPRVPRDSGPEVAGPRVHDGTPEVAGPRVHQGGTSEIVARDSLEAFVSRLTGLDATLDEVEAVRAWWDQPLEEGEHTREMLLRMSDDELRQLIADGRAEFEHGTMTEDEQAQRRFEQAIDAARPEAENVTAHGTVEQVLEWVGDDRARAHAALEAEQTAPDSEPRKTLVAALEKLIDAEEPGADG